MSANALPLSSLDTPPPASPQKGVRPMVVRESALGIPVSLWTKTRYYFVRFGAWKGLAFAVLAVALAPFGFAVIPGVTPSLKLASNAVYQGGNPRERCIANFKVKTATSLRSGVFVIIDTTDAEIKVAGAEAANVVGILSEINWTQPKLDTSTVPTAADMVTVILIGHGCRVKARNGANIAMGDRISVSATGRAAAIGTGTQVGRALESADGSGSEGNLLVVI